MLRTTIARNVKVLSQLAPATGVLAKRNLTTYENAPANGTTTATDGTVRPVSPSIQIWDFSPTGYLHVGSRITGAVLAGGFSLVGLTAAVSHCDVPYMLDTFKLAAPILVPVAKLAVAFPLAYHGVFGVRQIYQDVTGKGYTAKFQDDSSYALAAIAGVTALAAAFYTADHPDAPKAKAKEAPKAAAPATKEQAVVKAAPAKDDVKKL